MINQESIRRAFGMDLNRISCCGFFAVAKLKISQIRILYMQIDVFPVPLFV